VGGNLSRSAAIGEGRSHFSLLINSTLEDREARGSIGYGWGEIFMGEDLGFLKKRSTKTPEEEKRLRLQC